MTIDKMHYNHKIIMWKDYISLCNINGRRQSKLSNLQILFAPWNEGAEK